MAPVSGNCGLTHDLGLRNATTGPSSAPGHDCYGSFSDFGGRNRDVRFPPDSDRAADIAGGPFRANRRHVLFHDQDRTVRELYNSIGSAANQPVVER
jgi:hypothetical protein